MVEVRFASVEGVEAGIKCTLDSVVKYTDEAGLCSFFGISQGAHSYSVEAPAGWKFDYGYDYFNSPLSESGITVIEWVPYPDIPFPESEPWMMKFGFKEISISIPTTLTISAPATVEPEETFYITGILYETNTGIPITNQIIDLSYNGVTLGSAVTGIDGDYLIQAFIPTAGTYTLKAAYAGTTTLGASEATSRVSTGGISLAPIAAIALIAYAVLRK